MSQGNSLEIKFGVGSGDLHVGECIYCGSKENLSDEHPIPYALWGSWVLKSASCAECARKTSKMELEILREGLEGVREYFKSPSRRSKKKNRRTGIIRVENEDGNFLDAPIDDVIHYCVMPAFNNLPRKILGTLKSKKHRIFNAKMILLKSNPHQSTIGYWGPSVKFNVTTWARFIVKVAYGEYIRTVDVNFRSKAVSNFIINGVGDLTNFIGGRPEGPAAAFFYIVRPCILYREKKQSAIISYVRLFCFKNSPSYIVHLGDSINSQLPTGVPILREWSNSNIFPTYSKDDLLEDIPENASWGPSTGP